MSRIRFLEDSHAVREARGADPVVDEPLLPEGAAREGLVAGLVAAAGVALWFFVTDLISGAPLATPRHLGAVLADALGLTSIALSPFGAVAFYTVIHFVAFALVGLAAILCIIYARREPQVLAGALIAFVVAEMVFYFLLASLGAVTPTGPLTIGQVAVGNLIGLAILGLALWRWHPELGPEFHRALAERD